MAIGAVAPAAQGGLFYRMFHQHREALAQTAELDHRDYVEREDHNRWEIEQRLQHFRWQREQQAAYLQWRAQFERQQELDRYNAQLEQRRELVAEQRENRRMQWEHEIQLGKLQLERDKFEDERRRRNHAKASDSGQVVSYEEVYRDGDA